MGSPGPGEVTVTRLARSALSDAEIQGLDPYALMAAIGKEVIHPGGRRSTEELIGLADATGPSGAGLSWVCGVVRNMPRQELTRGTLSFDGGLHDRS